MFLNHLSLAAGLVFASQWAPAFAAASFDPTKTVIDCTKLTGSNVASNVGFSLKAFGTDNQPYVKSDLQFLINLAVTSISPNNHLLDSGSSTQQNILNSLTSQTLSYDFGRSDGTWASNFTINLAANFSLSVLYYDAVSGNNLPVGNGASCPLTLLPSDPAVAYLTNRFTSVTVSAGTGTDIPVNAVDQFGNPVPISPSDVVCIASFANFDELASVTASRAISVSYSNVDSETVNIRVLTYVTGNLNLKFIMFGSLNPLASFPPTASLAQLTVPVYAGSSDIASSVVVDSSFFSQSRKTSASSTVVLISERDINGNGIKPGADNRSPFTLSLVNVSSGLPAFQFTSVPGSIPGQTNYHVINFGPVTNVGSYIVQVTRIGLGVKGSPLNGGKVFTVTPGFINPSTSFIVASSSSASNQIYPIGASLKFSIIGLDAYGNMPPVLSPTDLDQLDISAVNTITGDTINPDPSTVQANYNTGVITFSLVPTKPGNYSVFSSLYLTNLANTGNVQFFSESPTSSVHLIGDGASSCAINSLCRFVVQCYDNMGNLQSLKSDDVITLSFSDPSLVDSVTVQALGGGSYAVSYIALNSGKIVGQISVNGQAVQAVTINVPISDGTKGILIGSGVITSVFMAGAGFIFYRHMQIKKMHAQWESMKKAAYKEYEINGTSKQQASLKNPASITGNMDEVFAVGLNTEAGGEREDWDGAGSNTALNSVPPDSDWQAVQRHLAKE